MRMNCVTNYDYLISNGKLYVRNIQASYDALYQDGLFQISLIQVIMN